MPRPHRILDRILSGTADRNIRFDDLRSLVLALGFDERIRGDHFIYSRSNVIEIINLQPGPEGHAKPYQVRQVRELVVKYKLRLEDSNA